MRPVWLVVAVVVVVVASGRLLGSKGAGRSPMRAARRVAPSVAVVRRNVTKESPYPIKLTIIQITDVYTLENFPSLRTMILEKKRSGEAVVTVLTGDFLAPYLLSSIDHGAGMMRMLRATPIDVVCFGNHDADVPHEALKRHIRDFPGVWLCSNVRLEDDDDDDRDVSASGGGLGRLAETAVVELACSSSSSSSSDTHNRPYRVGLCAILTDDETLYAPGAFGGATIEDPWVALRRVSTHLREREACDVVVPLQHLYEPDDERTCREFSGDFPVVLSGHDHHKVDRVVGNTRLLKPGLDAVFATVCELSWPPKPTESSDDERRQRGAAFLLRRLAFGGPKPSMRRRRRRTRVPRVEASLVRVADWPPDEDLLMEVRDAYEVLAPLRSTELARIPPRFRPFSSRDARAKCTTVGTYLCYLIKKALLATRQVTVDCVALMGGNVRGSRDYPDDAFFSLEALQTEINDGERIGVVRLPGRVLAEGLADTHRHGPKPGWFQFDDGVVESDEDGTIVAVDGTLLDPDRMYTLATKIPDLTNGQSPPLKRYFDGVFLAENGFPGRPPLLRDVEIRALLMKYCARSLWIRLWTTTKTGADVIDDPQHKFAAFDLDADGVLTVDEILAAMTRTLGLRVDPRERSLAALVHDVADVTGDGLVTLADFERFAQQTAASPGLLHLDDDGIFP